MAYCTFTNCLSILASGFTERTTLDSRSGVGMTSTVGQMAFFGSSDNVGPLGMVFQHICANGICRSDITSTRYGVSGNDLSLNIDSTNPFSTGGVLIKYGGGVAMGTGQPCGALDVWKQGSGASTGGDNLILRGGNSNQQFAANQIRFGYNGGIGYSHAIKTRHNSGANATNAIDFFLWTTSDAIETVGTRNVMTLDGTGYVGIGTCSPGERLSVNGALGQIQLRVDSSDGSTINVRPNSGRCGWVSFTEDAVADRWGIGIKNGDAKLYFASGNVASGGGTTRMVIDGCNLGINTTSTSAKLSVEGSATDVENVARFNNQVNCTTRIIVRNSNHTAYLGLSSTSTADSLATGMCPGAMTLGFGNNFPIQFWNGSPSTVKMTIASDGNVGVGIITPCAAVDAYKSGSGGTSTGDNLLVRGGNNSTSFGTNQIRFGFNGGTGYSHAIKSRHQSNFTCDNALDFFLWTPSDAVETVGTKNVMTLDGSGNVGINTCRPAFKLQVNGSGGDTVGFFGASGMTANQSVFFQVGKNTSSTNNAGELSFKYVGDDNASNMVSLGFYGNGQKLNVLKNGYTGIGTTSPSYALHVNGTFYAAGSSIKYKEGICNYDTDSCLFMCLKPVTYQYKDEWQHLGRELKSQSQIGLIAEDVAQVMPELAVLVNEEDEKVVRNVDYEKLSVVLLKEVQKLRLEVDELKNNK